MLSIFGRSSIIPKQQCALATDDSRRLEVSWNSWEPIIIRLDGEVIGRLKVGEKLVLADGSVVSVQKKRDFLFPWNQEVSILHNESLLVSVHLPPVKFAFDKVCQSIFFLAILNLLAGLLGVRLARTLSGDIKSIDMLGIVVFAGILGLLFLILAFFVKRRSRKALIVFVVLLAVEGMATCVLSGSIEIALIWFFFGWYLGSWITQAMKAMGTLDSGELDAKA